MSKKSVFCIVTSHHQSDQILAQLKTAKFARHEISVLFPHLDTTSYVAYENTTRGQEGVAAGAGTGGVIGGALGWVAGISALAIPGVGPLIAAGPIIAALSGIAIGTAIGGIAGGLIGLGLPETVARRYEGKVKAGGILISVHTTNSEEIIQARNIFTKAAAQDICVIGETSPHDHRIARPAGSVLNPIRL